MPADALGVQCSMAVNIQPQPSSTVNTRTPSVPHMRLGAWVMISPTWGFPHGGGSDGARAGCSRASPGAPACGKHGCHDRPEAEPRPCGVPRPPRGMPPGRPRWPPAEPRPRSRASVPGALLVGAQRWPAAGISWRRTRNGQNPRPHRPAGGRRPNPCRERWRHSSLRPPPPQRAGRLPSWPPAVPPA